MVREEHRQMDKEKIKRLIREIERNLETISEIVDFEEDTEEIEEEIDLSKPIKKLPTQKDIKEILEEAKEEEKIKEIIFDPFKCDKCNKKFKKGKIKIVDDNLIQELSCKKCNNIKYLRQKV